jgi:hypothetical protein
VAPVALVLLAAWVVLEARVPMEALAALVAPVVLADQVSPLLAVLLETAGQEATAAMAELLPAAVTAGWADQQITAATVAPAEEGEAGAMSVLAEMEVRAPQAASTAQILSLSATAAMVAPAVQEEQALTLPAAQATAALAGLAVSEAMADGLV